MRPNLIGILVTGLLAAACTERTGPEGTPPPKQPPAKSSHVIPTLPETRGGQDLVGKKWPGLAPDRWLKSEGGRPAESGGVTLYRWWTDGCHFCEESLPAIESWRLKYGPRGLRTVAVYHAKPPRAVKDEVIQNTANTLGYGGPIAVDEQWSELRRLYLDGGERNATSVSILVDSSSIVRFVHPGPSFFPSDDPASAQENEDHRLLELAIEALLEK